MIISNTYICKYARIGGLRTNFNGIAYVKIEDIKKGHS